jgi:hypothetical protein
MYDNRRPSSEERNCKGQRREYKRLQERAKVQKHQSVEANDAIGLKSSVESWQTVIQGIIVKTLTSFSSFEQAH